MTSDVPLNKKPAGKVVMDDLVQLFLELLGPLDLAGWAQLLHAPVGGWPAREIIAFAYRTKRLSALIPIDVVGMATDVNPNDLYR